MNEEDQNDYSAMDIEMNRRLQDLIDQKKIESEVLKKILKALSKLDKENKSYINDK